MKRILIEANVISAPYCGLKEVIIRFGNGLADRAEMLREKYGIEVAFIVPPDYKGCFGNSVKYMINSGWTRFFIKHVWCGRVDLFHAPHQYCKIKAVAGAKHTLMTIHDINFIYEKEGLGLARSIRRLQWRLNHADYLSFISKFAQKDTSEHFALNVPQRIIYNGATDMTALAASASDDILPHLPERFFFHVSSLLPKKNIHLLVEMMKYLPEENLVIAGTWQDEDDYVQEMRAAVDKAPNIIALDRVSEEQKALLYARCSAFMFPSLCEGFGLPPIEAMKMGKPVFLSTLTSLPEVGGDYAFYWNDLTPDAMAKHVRTCMSGVDDSLADNLRAYAAQFDWDNCIDSYIDYYVDILNGNIKE